MLKQILFYNEFLFAQCFQTSYTVFLSHSRSEIIPNSSSKNIEAAWEGFLQCQILLLFCS